MVQDLANLVQRGGPTEVGRPVALEFMASITGGSAQGNVGAIFGDFRSYIIAERLDLMVQRDPRSPENPAS